MSLATDKKNLLTIVTESVVEQTLLRELERMGVKGYTVSDARGMGSRGLRDAAWNEVANVRIEIICARQQAEEILLHLQTKYFKDYAMVSFLQEVEVLRAEKF
jgi:nitrogen regulatory protein PII